MRSDESGRGRHECLRHGGYTEPSMRRCPALAFALAAVAVLSGQEQSPLERKLSEKIEATLKASGAPSASIAVVIDGKIAFVRAFGKAGSDAAATADTIYAV